jgi:hypothetical protein
MFYEIPWDSIRFYDVLVNQSVPTDANRGLTSYRKMQEYNIELCITYNMNEKDFFVGITIRSRHIFSKAVWQVKLCTAAIEDDNRKWITLLACVCADVTG